MSKGLVKLGFAVLNFLIVRRLSNDERKRYINRRRNSGLKMDCMANKSILENGQPRETGTGVGTDH